MNLVILTPEQEYFSGEVTSVIVPGTTGQFEILNDHAPIVSALIKGKVKVSKGEGGEINFLIEKGFIEVLSNEVALLVQGLNDTQT